MFIATLIADGLSKQQVDDGWEALGHSAAAKPGGSWSWLDEGKAADLPFAVEGGAGGDATHLLRQAVPGIDIVVQPAAHREKRLLVADMDSTMITVECIDELADYARIKAEVAAVTEAAMRGELDFEGALDARVALLAGLDASAIDRCLAERVRDTPGAATLVRTMRARGAECVLVSGGFTAFAKPVAARLGFHQAIANVLEVGNGTLTGRVRKPIVGAATKLDTLLARRAALGLPSAAVLAVGDGANDLPMVQAAGLGVAYRAKPIVAAAAAARIDHGDLTALLYAQGIPRAEWVTG